MERYEEPSDDVIAWFSAQGVMLDQEQRYRIAQLEVIEGSQGMLQLWAALSGSVEEKIQAMGAIQERRGKEAWRLETDYQADKEALLRAAAAERTRRSERSGKARTERRTAERAAKAAQEVLWLAFEQAIARLTRQWGKGAWGKLEAELVGVTWKEKAVCLRIEQTGPAAAKKAAFLSVAMSEILGTEFKVEIEASRAIGSPAARPREHGVGWT